MVDDPVAYHMIEVEKFLPTWKKPALVMFGDGDPITKGKENKDKLAIEARAVKQVIKFRPNWAELLEDGLRSGILVQCVSH